MFAHMLHQVAQRLEVLDLIIGRHVIYAPLRRRPNYRDCKVVLKTCNDNFKGEKWVGELSCKIKNVSAEVH